MEWLDLSGNKLRSLNINILRALPKLSTIYLNNNPLQCDCQLKEVKRWCEDRNIRTGYGSKVPECDTPREVEGMRWGVLKNGKCLEGNIHYYGYYNNSRYNYTQGKDENDYEFLKKYEIPVYAVPFIFGTTGNVIILIIIIFNKDMRTVPNLYIINLAISDIIFLTVLFFEAYANSISDVWQYDEFMCTFFRIFRRVSICLSAYSVALLSIQRYRVTVTPFHVRVSSKPTWRETVAAICGVWIVAALFALPSAVSRYQCSNDAKMVNRKYYCCVVVFELLASCVLPLCVIAFTYIMTARLLVESSRSIFEGTQNSQQKHAEILQKLWWD
jgi:hypothetical protein